jgi:branched-chain amino acid transport system ATP-binding protein
MTSGPERALSVTGLNVWYGPAQAIFDLDLEVAAGETVGLLGRNGAGKTSTILGILGQGARRRGHIVLGGTDISSFPTHRAARAGLAWVPDNRRVFPTLTVRENFELARAAVRRKETLSDSDLVDVFPLLGRIMERRGGLLSGGEAQVVALARALIPRARVILIDEPTEGLAPVVVDSVVEALKRMRTDLGQSVLLAEANARVIEEVCDRVTLLSVGRSVYAGSMEAFQADDSVRRQYLALGAG